MGLGDACGPWDGFAPGDSGASGAGLSGADMRQISQALRKIGQTLTAAAQGSQGSSASAGMDSDGDYDNSSVGTAG